jgi:DNA-binding CsgD family transcriptional regulator
MIAYGSGFLMASFFPFYFYKAFDLKSIRWHALFGVPLFLMLPYLVFFVLIYAINGNLNVDIRFGMIVPLIYSIILLWVIFRAIRNKYEAERNKNKYFEEIALYCAVVPWASLTFFGLVEESQLMEVLFTNTGLIVITIIFIVKSVKQLRLEYEQLIELTINSVPPKAFLKNCNQYALTIREIEIVQLIRQAFKYKEIGKKLYISEFTVKKHIENIYKKAGVSGRIELIIKLEA